MISCIEKIAKNEYNPDHVSQCAFVHSHITNPGFMSGCKSAQAFARVFDLWFENPDETRASIIFEQLKIDRFQIPKASEYCTTTHIGLMILFTGMKLEEVGRRGTFDHGCQEAIVNNEMFLKEENDPNQFIVYGFFLQVDSKKKNVAGHVFTLVQYLDETKVRYFLLQSYYNHYSLSECIAKEKEKHLPNGSFSHDDCLVMLQKLENLTKSTHYNDETDRIFNDLFHVSIPGLNRNANCNFSVCYNWKRSNFEKCESFNKRISLVFEQIKSFSTVTTLSKEEYLKKLNGIEFVPRYFTFTFYSCGVCGGSCRDVCKNRIGVILMFQIDEVTLTVPTTDSPCSIF